MTARTPDPLAFLTDPTDTRIQSARTRSCDICKAKVGQWCVNRCQPDQQLPGRLVHIGRTQDRTREPKGNDHE